MLHAVGAIIICWALHTTRRPQNAENTHYFTLNPQRGHHRRRRHRVVYVYRHNRKSRNKAALRHVGCRAATPLLCVRWRVWPILVECVYIIHLRSYTDLISVAPSLLLLLRDLAGFECAFAL